jgi:hypothetical protein
MKFWFCEKCGKRITEADVQSGVAVETDTKVYCKECSPETAATPARPKSSKDGMKAVSRESKKHILPSAPSASAASGDVHAPAAHGASAARISRAHIPHATHGSGASGADRKGAAPTQHGPPMRLILAGGAGVAALLLGIVMVLSSGRTPPASKPTATPVNVPVTPNTSPRVASNPSTATAASVETAVIVEAPVPLGQRADPEKPANDAFDALTVKLKQLGDIDQPAAIEQFIITYPNSIPAARARRMLADLKTKAETPATPATPPVEQTAAVPPNTDPKSTATAVATVPTVPAMPAVPIDPSQAPFFAFETDFIAALRARQPERLATVVSLAEKNPVLAPRQKELATVKSVLDWMAELSAAIPKGVAALKTVNDFKLPVAHGEPIRLGVDRPFKFSEIKDDTIYVTNQGLTLSIPLSSLPDECLTRLSLLGLGDNAHAQALRVFSGLLAAKFDSASIKAALPKLKSSAPELPVFQALLAMTDSLAREPGDFKELIRLSELKENFRSEKLKAALDAYRGAYDERVLADHKKELDSIDEMVQELDPVSLIAHYSFDAIDGTVLTDSSGKNNHATLIKAPQLVPGKIGQALSFNGVDQYVQLPDKLFRAHPTLTLSLWFNTSEPGILAGYQSMQVGNPTIDNYVPVAYVGSDGHLRAKFWNNEGNPPAAGVVTDAKWHHVAICASAGAQRVYLDGTLFATIDGSVNHLEMIHNQLAAGFSRSWPAALTPDGWSFYKGLLDDVHIYDRALTEAEVQRLAQKK